MDHPRGAGILAVLLLSAFSTLWLLVQTPNFLSGYDFVRMDVCFKSYFRAALLAGRLPLWNPYIGLGRPFLADITTATLYPPTLLVVPLGVAAGTVLSVFLHQSLALFGGQRLGRHLGATQGASWIVAAGFALCSPVAGRLATGMVEVYYSLCWWPVLLWLGIRLQDRWNARVAAGYSCALAMAILAGNPPILYVELLGLAIFLLLRQSWPGNAAGWRAVLGNLGGLAAATLLGACMAAVQLLPFLELVGQGNRPLHAPGFAAADGMQAMTWLSLLVPASTVFATNWEYNLHVGLVPLFAAATLALSWRDRNARALLGLGIAGALLAEGDHTPFFRWALSVLPGASALRIPSRYGIWVSMAVLGAASLGLSRRPIRPFLPLVLCAAASGAGLLWLAEHIEGNRSDTAAFLGAHVALVAAAAGLVGLWCFRPLRNRHRGILGAVIALYCAGNWLGAIALEAPTYSDPGFQTQDGAVRAALEDLRLFPASGVPPRISYNPGDVRENAGMIQGFAGYTSYATPTLDRTWRYLHLAAGIPLSTVDYIQLPVGVYERAPQFGSLSLTARLDHGTHSLEILTRPDPRAYVVFDEVLVTDWETAERDMVSGGDIHNRAYVETATTLSSPPGSGALAAAAAITRFEPERVSIRTQTSAPGILVLDEAWYPGWVASIDGTPTDVFPVNGWMRGAVVPSGSHEVVFRFSQRHLRTGMALSLAAAVLTLCLALRQTPRTAGEII